MSVSKRSQKRQADVQSALPPPASKRLRASETSHLQKRTGLDFLVRDDAHLDRKVDAKLTNGLPKNKSTTVDESHAVVAPDANDESDGSEEEGSPEVIELSSNDNSGDDSSSVDSEELRQFMKASQMTNGHPPVPLKDDAGPGAANSRPHINGTTPHTNADGEDDQPTFGDILQANHPDPIDVQRSFAHGEPRDLVPATSNRALDVPSATSLGTVLTQALRTNDAELLESCFRVTDLESIRATIQRVQSQHIAKLLQRIAERMHRRPGRAGNLMVWVQWSLVAHGGYLATQPDLMRQLSALARVIRERATGLQPLLHLKGKLDMLSAQLEIRRSLQATSRGYNEDDMDNEEAVLYIEGQDRGWSDDEDEIAVDLANVKHSISVPLKTSKKSKSKQEEDESGSDEEESEPDLPNGATLGDDEESSADEAEDEEMFDIEAEEASSNEEESDASAGSEAESEDEDEDDDEEDVDGEESEVSVQPPRHHTLNRKR